MTVPCRLVDGLSVGLMFVGRHWNESDLSRAAYAFEQSVDWQTL